MIVLKNTYKVYIESKENLINGFVSWAGEEERETISYIIDQAEKQGVDKEIHSLDTSVDNRPIRFFFSFAK